MTEFLKLAEQRQSCRNYDATKEVEREKLESLIEAVRISPSACNAQPWKYILVQGEQAKDVRAAVQLEGRNKFTENCPAFALIVEQHAILKPGIAERMGSQKFAQIDIGLSAAHYCLEAEAQGLATCMIGWMDEEKLKESFGIPKEQTVRLVIATGYAAAEDKHRNKIRKATSEMSEII